jgi:hypothetical protein
MLPALMTTWNTGELHFVYPCDAEYRLTRTLTGDYFLHRLLWISDDGDIQTAEDAQDY